MLLGKAINRSYKQFLVRTEKIKGGIVGIGVPLFVVAEDCLQPLKSLKVCFVLPKELVIKACRMVPHFRMVAWDVSVLENGEPVLIEANLYDGQLDSHQIHNGPLFGENTEKIMREVFDKN